MSNAYGTYTALSGNANSLANAGFASLGVIDFGSTPPHECLVQVSAQASSTPTTTTSRSLLVYVRSSLDGTLFSDSGSSASELNLSKIGTVSLTDTAAHVGKAMAVSPSFGGALPRKVEVIVKNDCGVSLAASGQTGAYLTETFG